MKTIGLIAIFVTSLQFGFAQSLLDTPVSYRAEQLTFEDALYELSEASGVPFSFTNEMLPPGRLSIEAQQASLRKALEELLRGTPLDFRVIGAQIVIYLPEDREFTISGILKDSISGEPLINANVLEKNSGKGTATNEYGYYSITLPAGPVEIKFSYVGYEDRSRPLYLQRSRRLDEVLFADLTLQAIEVISDSLLSGTALSSEGGSINLGVSDVERLPALAGEPDVIRTTYLLPGVQTGADGVGGIHVRGGGNGQNLIMLDGVPVYNINHTAGLFSVFNTNAIRSVKLYRGGFPARYGGRISSVLDVRTKEGNRREFGAEGEVGLLSTRLTVEGPIIKNKSSFIVSGRHSLVGFYLQPLADRNSSDNNYNYRFYDLNAKVNTNLSSRDHIYLSYYRGQDDFRQTGLREDTLTITSSGSPETQTYLSRKDYNYDLSWNTQSAVLRWTHLFGDKLFGSMAATFSGLDTDIAYEEHDSLQALSMGGEGAYLYSVGRYRSRIRDLGLRVDFDYRTSSNHQLRFGAQVVQHDYHPGLLSLQVADGPSNIEDAFLSGQPRTNALEYASYVESIYSPVDQLQLNAGLHLAAFQVPGKVYVMPQPRLLVKWQWHKEWQLRGYFSRMAQFAHLLFNTSTGLPTEMWVPSTENIRPEEAWQVGAATTWTGLNGWKFTAEAYGKRMKNLLSYVEGATLLGNWSSSVTSGRGEAYGLELTLEKEFGATRGWISYTLSRATRQFEEINNGLRYPYRYDRRHNTKLAALHRFSKSLEISVSYVYGTGLAISLPSGQYDIFLPGVGRVVVVEYDARNAFRLPAYHRLDLGLNILFDRPRVKHRLNVGLYNVYNRRNALFVSTTFDTNGQLSRFEPVAFLPILPSINYAAEF